MSNPLFLRPMNHLRDPEAVLGRTHRMQHPPHERASVISRPCLLQPRGTSTSKMHTWCIDNNLQIRTHIWRGPCSDTHCNDFSNSQKSNNLKNVWNVWSICQFSNPYFFGILSGTLVHVEECNSVGSFHSSLKFLRNKITGFYWGGVKYSPRSDGSYFCLLGGPACT